MPLIVQTINFTNYSNSIDTMSYKRNVVDCGGYRAGNWVGLTTLLANQTVASADVVTFAQEKNFDDVAQMIIPATAMITKLAFRTFGAITLGAATGTIKLATAATVTTSGLTISSAAAVSNVVAAQATPVTQNNLATPVTIGSSDVTFKIFATDGSNVASTMTVTPETKIIVEIAFIMPTDFPGTLLDLGTKAGSAVDVVRTYT